MRVLSHVQLFLDSMDYRPPTPQFMGFAQARILELSPFPTPGDFSNLGIELISLTLAGRFFTTEPPGRMHNKDFYPENLLP